MGVSTPLAFLTDIKVSLTDVTYQVVLNATEICRVSKGM